MEEKQTRVNLYTELRNKIEKMDTLSFDDPNKYQDSQIPILHEEAMSSDELQSKHIKKNTLSISIEELIKQHDEYTSSYEKKELNKKYKEVKKKRSGKVSLSSLFKNVYFLIGLGVVVVTLIVVLCLVFGGKLWV